MVRSFRLAILCTCCSALLPCAGAIASGAGQQASYYTWRDAHGTVHVSASPPPGHVATELKVREDSAQLPPPAAVRPETAPSSEPSPEALKAKNDYRRQACRSARDDIARLDRVVAQSGSRVGDAATQLAAEQRAQAKARARQRMLQYCGRS